MSVFAAEIAAPTRRRILMRRGALLSVECVSVLVCVHAVRASLLSISTEGEICAILL